MIPIILATSSPYKYKQFATLKLPFTQQASDISEHAQPNESAEAMSLRLAKEKASHIARENQADCWIIGCDQAAELNGSLLSKPGSKEKAEQMLEHCSGKKICFYSSVALVNGMTRKTLSATTKTHVSFRALSLNEIRHYINHEHALDCAGGFKVESLGISLFSEIESDDPSALVGLPLIKLNHLLMQCGINALSPTTPINTSTKSLAT